MTMDREYIDSLKENIEESMKDMDNDIYVSCLRKMMIGYMLADRPRNNERLYDKNLTIALRELAHENDHKLRQKL